MTQLALAVGDAYGAQDSTDKSYASATGLRVSQFKSFLEDCRWQPPWRNMADKCVDYYDGNQLDQDTLNALDKKGMGPLIRNITAPLVNVVLGMEARTRSDWRVSADQDSVQDIAEALSAKLHEVEREARADRACSDAYAGQVKAGLGWVEVSRNADPFVYPYRCSYVHRREIWWDWRDDSPDLAKARYLIRKRWFDVDQACAYFPEHEDILQSTVGDPSRYDLITTKRALDLGMSLEEARGLDIEDIEEWRSFDRKRLCLYEVWYRVFTRGMVAKLPSGAIVEVDQRNQVHAALMQRGLIQPQKAVYSKLRMSMWAGPHKLMDTPSPKRHFPYVPFWGYREDRTMVPYGLVRAMLSPQDEVNARLQKMMWLLGAKRVRMDSDALDTKIQSPADMLLELARPDAVIFTNPNRINKQDAINIDDNLALADAQYKVLQDAIMSAQQVVGLFNATLGRDSGTTANSALQTLVDQGTMALAEINDNYRYGRRLVGERALDQMRDDMIGVEMEVMAGDTGRKRKIVLNQRVTPQQAQQEQAQLAPSENPNVDPDAAQQASAVMHMKNDVSAAKVRVALDDVPSSPSYREQQFTMLAELTKGLPPQLQALVAPFIIEASDLQKRREMADTMRKALGQPTPKTPEEERQAEKQQIAAMQEAQQMQKKAAMLELQEHEAKINKLNAEAEKMRAEVGGNPELAGARDEAMKRCAEVEAKSREEIDKLTAEMMTLRMTSAQRETKLLMELSQCVSELKANAGNQAVEKRKAEIEKEVAEIERDKEVQVANINADSQKVIDSLSEKIATLQADMVKGLADAKQQAADAQAEAKAAEKRLRDEQRVADKARKEAEAKAAKEDKANDKGGDKGEAPTAINLAVNVDSGGESTIEIKKNTDGSYTGKKTTAKKAKK